MDCKLLVFSKHSRIFEKPLHWNYIKLAVIKPIRKTLKSFILMAGYTELLMQLNLVIDEGPQRFLETQPLSVACWREGKSIFMMFPSRVPGETETFQRHFNFFIWILSKGASYGIIHNNNT